MTNDEINITDFKQLEGISPQTIRVLKGHYSSILELALSLPDDVKVKTHISPELSLEAVNAANDFLSKHDLIKSMMRNGLEDLERREQIFRISTGSSDLDELLNGGIESKAITEFFAPNGLGKTQLCLSVGIQAAIPKEQGGLDSNVIYIDTEGAYRPNRVKQICLARGYDPNDVLKKFTILTANYKANLLYIINELPKLVEEKKAKLIILDSIIALFRAEYGGRGELATRMQTIGSIMHKLSRITDIHDVAVLITNQMQDNVDGFSKIKKVPCGGNTLGHASTYRIELKKGEKGLRKAKIYKSPESDNEEVEFKITDKGIVDAVKKKESTETIEEESDD
ncbi:MAG: DNA repair and recombination protein RadA [Candidatus Nitrosocosmicus sp.]|nr:DNA repair and recombination protein RadA [Candidatus Nitrosocosmicus sp.]